MNLPNLMASESFVRAQPQCPVFGVCGGCAYQDLPYEEELRRKKEMLHQILDPELALLPEVFEEIVPSPESYHYRYRLDIGLYRKKTGEVDMGFMKEGKYRVVPIDACAIARKEISDFLPTLKEAAIQKMPTDYRTANLVVRMGADGRIVWGGIGRRSLRMKERDYLWAVIEGKKIYFGMETFFQANFSILEALIKKIRELGVLSADAVFFDLYAGVGFFTVCLGDLVQEVILIEENPYSVELAKFNVRRHQMEHKAKIIHGKVEDQFSSQLAKAGNPRKIAMIDPPRKGLEERVIKDIVQMSKEGGKGASKNLDALLYLSCYPRSLARDLKLFCQHGWKIEKIIPFDFFPKTQHLETLVLLFPPMKG